MGNMWYRVGWGGWFNPWLEQWPSYVNNRLTTNPWTGAAMTYDAAGNLTNDGYQSYAYDATGQQTSANGTALMQSYDGDRLRVKKVESGATTYYLRSSVLEGRVVSELNGSGGFQRGYVYLGNDLLALQESNQVSWVHQDPLTKSQRITNGSGTVTSTIDLDPWGGETARSSNQAFQPHRYTSYERDGNGSDEAMMRRYNGKWHRFVQPDPSDDSYDLSDPQSFNRYAYAQNDPVNFIDPSGLDPGGVLGGWAGITLNPPSGSVTIYGSFNNSAGVFGDFGPLIRRDVESEPFQPELSVHDFLGGPQDPRPKKEIAHIKEVPKKHTRSCVEVEWEIFKAKVEAVKAAAEEHFQERELPWIVKLFQGIAAGIGGNDPIDPGNSAGARLKDAIPDIINIMARDKEIEEGTAREAEKRDQRIKENCKKP
jgi:RHS repeat-associated protein